MVNVHDDPLELAPSAYDEWVEQFVAERDRIRRCLTDAGHWYAVERIHHVGSTAVPGLASKDIVDVDIVVHDDAVFDVARAIETGLGGTRVENTNEWQPVFRRHEEQRFNDHVFGVSSDGWRVSVVTRDVLRAHEPLRREYERLKRQLMSEHDGLEAYSVGKSAFIEELLRVARGDDGFAYDFEIPRLGD